MIKLTGSTVTLVTLVLQSLGMLYVSVHMLFNQEKTLSDLLGINFDFPFLASYPETQYLVF